MLGEAGQPHVPILGESIKDEELLLAASRLDSTKPRKRSLFARQLLAAREGKSLNLNSVPQPVFSSIPKPPSNCKLILHEPWLFRVVPEPLKELDDFGPGVIKKEKSVAANDLVRIHEMSINWLSQLSEEQILREKETLLSSMGM